MHVLIAVCKFLNFCLGRRPVAGHTQVLPVVIRHRVGIR